jgi:thiol:disulfide interchange protein DsbD
VNSVWRRAQVHPGDEAVLAVVVHVPTGWHINVSQGQWAREHAGASAAAGDFEPIFTQVAAGKLPTGVTMGPVQYPQPVMLKVAYVRGAFPALTGTVRVYVPLRVAASVRPGRYAVELGLTYQACNEKVCLQPRDRMVAVELVVVPAGTEVGPADEADFAGYLEGAPGDAGLPGREVAVFDFLGRSFAVGNSAVILLLALAVGVLLNFTPCVLPVVPLKVLALHQQAGTWKRGLALGGAFSLGIVGAFAVMGLLAAGAVTAVGRLDWGQQFSYWPFTVGLGLIVAVMALGMMGLFTTQLPQVVYRVAPRHDTYGGSFLFGVLTAALSTPCTGPMMAGALTWAARQPAWLGLMTFVAMGVGMALPYLLLVANPKWLARLPRTGPGSVLVKETMGGLLAAVAVYFFGIAGKPVWGVQYWWVVAAAGAGTGLWVIYRGWRVSRRRWVRGSVALLGAAAVAGSIALAGAMTAPRLWRPYDPAAVAAAQASGQTVVIEFTADWCLNCKALELAVFRDAQVAARLGAKDVAGFRVDLTSQSNRQGWALLNELGVTGIPLTAVYRPGTQRPQLLTSIYTKTALLEAIGGGHAGTDSR